MFSQVFIFQLNNKKPITVLSCPEAEESTCKRISTFGYACEINEGQVTEIIQYFARDDEHRWAIYSHCHNYNACICITGKKPYFSLYRRILAEIRKTMNKPDPIPIHKIAEYLERLYFTTITPNLERVDLQLLGDSQTCCLQTLLDRVKFAKIDKTVYAEYVMLLEDVVVELYFWILLGGKIFLYSKSPKRVSYCVLSAVSVIRPLKYQELIICLLPSVDLLGNPCPGIYGVTKSVFLENQSMVTGDYLAVDLDLEEGFIHGKSVTACVPQAYKEFLAQEIGRVNKIKKANARLPQGHNLYDDFLSRFAKAYMYTTVGIIGQYRQACQRQLATGQFSLPKERFVNILKAQMPNSEEFYDDLYGISHIKHFIDKRLNAINSNKEIQDDFDRMCSTFDYANEFTRLASNKKKKWHMIKQKTNQGRDALQDKLTDLMGKINNHGTKLRPKKKGLPSGLKEGHTSVVGLQASKVSSRSSDDVLRAVSSYTTNTIPESYRHSGIFENGGLFDVENVMNEILTRNVQNSSSSSSLSTNSSSREPTSSPIIQRANTTENLIDLDDSPSTSYYVPPKTGFTPSVDLNSPPSPTHPSIVITLNSPTSRKNPAFMQTLEKFNNMALSSSGHSEPISMRNRTPWSQAGGRSTTSTAGPVVDHQSRTTLTFQQNSSSRAFDRQTLTQEQIQQEFDPLYSQHNFNP